MTIAPTTAEARKDLDSGLDTAPAAEEGYSATTSSKAQRVLRRPRLLLLVVLLSLLLGARVHDARVRASVPPPPDLDAGAVLTLPPVDIDLADGYFLRLGLALQTPEDADVTVDGTRAIELATALYSGRPVAQLIDGQQQAALKADLLGSIGTTYEDEVVDVYYTQFAITSAPGDR